jgi:hypothetical protein
MPTNIDGKGRVGCARARRYHSVAGQGKPYQESRTGRKTYQTDSKIGWTQGGNANSLDQQPEPIRSRMSGSDKPGMEIIDEDSTGPRGNHAYGLCTCMCMARRDNEDAPHRQW